MHVIEKQYNAHILNMLPGASPDSNKESTKNNASGLFWKHTLHFAQCAGSYHVANVVVDTKQRIPAHGRGQDVMQCSQFIKTFLPPPCLLGACTSIQKMGDSVFICLVAFCQHLLICCKHLVNHCSFRLKQRARVMKKLCT